MHKQSIWAILKEVYHMTGTEPVSDKQLEVVDLLNSYMEGKYRPVIVVPLETSTTQQAIADGTKRGRGRPKKI